MATVSNCNLPEDLYYVVEKHVWARYDDGVVTVGLTDVAQNLAKGIISVSPKKIGRAVEAGIAAYAAFLEREGITCAGS